MEDFKKSSVYRNMVRECETLGIDFKLVCEFPDQSISITGPMPNHVAKTYLAQDQAPIVDLPAFPVNYSDLYKAGNQHVMVAYATDILRMYIKETAIGEGKQFII